MLKIKNENSYRNLAQIFTPANFKKVVAKGDYKFVSHCLKYNIDNVDSRLYKEIINYAYKTLESNYRSEYIFKNTLFNEKLVKSYGFKDTIFLNEFRIGKSVADTVLLNGEVKVFEIKTDLDDFEKLGKQVSDYQKFANKVYVVVSSKNVSKVKELYCNSPLGIIEYTVDRKLNTIKEAIVYNDKLNHEAIFKTLRKHEYLEILTEYYGFKIDSPNTLIFKKSLELAMEIEIIEFQKLVCNKIKQRNIKCLSMLKSKETPKGLKQICYSLNLSHNEYLNLYKFLNTPI